MSGLNEGWQKAKYLKRDDTAVVRHTTDGYLVTDTCKVLCCDDNNYLVQLAVGVDYANPEFGAIKLIEADKITAMFAKLPTP